MGVQALSLEDSTYQPWQRFYGFTCVSPVIYRPDAEWKEYQIDRDAVCDVKRHGVADYPGENFWGLVYYREKKFCVEIWHKQSVVEILSHKRFLDLVFLVEARWNR